MPMIEFSSTDEVIEMANSSEYGLAAYIHTSNINTALRVSERLDYGMVGINEWSVALPEAPFGGMKQSGLGRESGPEGVYEYSNPRLALAVLLERPADPGKYGRWTTCVLIPGELAPPFTRAPRYTKRRSGLSVPMALFGPILHGRRGSGLATQMTLPSSSIPICTRDGTMAWLPPHSAEAVIVGGFTDFVDVLRAGGATGLAEEDDCTAVIVPDQLAGGAGFLAQTWDMHDSATEHVTLIRITPPSGPGALVFTTVGCLGQIGMNQAGIAIGINNLTATNGRVGVTWPFVVRKALAQTSIDDALVVILEAELAGAHNYLLFDEGGIGFNIEGMPGYRAVTRMEREPVVHTNHCLDPEAQLLEAPRPADLMKS